MAHSGSWLMIGVILMVASTARAAAVPPGALALQASVEAIAAMEERHDPSNAAFINGMRAAADMARAVIEVIAAWQEVQPVGMPSWASALISASRTSRPSSVTSTTQSSPTHRSNQRSQSDSDPHPIVDTAMFALHGIQSLFKLWKG